MSAADLTNLMGWISIIVVPICLLAFVVIVWVEVDPDQE
jgi:hypothetical protein